jgi:hypothetical protein
VGVAIGETNTLRVAWKIETIDGLKNLKINGFSKKYQENSKKSQIPTNHPTKRPSIPTNQKSS